MPYVIEDFYLAGIPQTALLGGLASRGISDHWTAGGIGRKGARDTAQFFVDRADRNASYHEIPWWEQGTRTFGVLRIVKAERAAHSMNPNPPTWAPNAEVRRILGDKVGDPNSVSYARSFAGMPADLVAAMKDPYFVACYVRRTRELLAQETTIKVERPLFNHGWGQPTTRTDAGDALIPAIYAGLYAQEEDMQYWKPVEELWDTAIGTQFWDGGGVAKTFTATERVRSIAESSDGKYRLIAYGQDELLVLDRWARTRPTAVPGSRVPTTGYGFPPASVVEVPTGITPEQLAQAQRLEFIRGRDEGTAAYAAAGALAAQGVAP